MLAHNEYGAEISDVSSQWAQIALQGPNAEEILEQSVDRTQIPQRYYTFVQTRLFGKPAIISRTGYTGEDGFEIYLEPADAPLLWETLMDDGEEFALAPAGLGARDTLRLEAAMPLYGHELTADISPLEAGLGRYVKLDKAEFVGRDALAKQKAEGLRRKRAGLEIEDRGIAREGATVLKDGTPVGHVTSGTKAPWIDRPIAMAMLATDQAAIGNAVDIDVRGRLLKATVIKLPFYKRQEAKA